MTTWKLAKILKFVKKKVGGAFFCKLAKNLMVEYSLPVLESLPTLACTIKSVGPWCISV